MTILPPSTLNAEIMARTAIPALSNPALPTAEQISEWENSLAGELDQIKQRAARKRVERELKNMGYEWDAKSRSWRMAG